MTPPSYLLFFTPRWYKKCQGRGPPKVLYFPTALRNLITEEDRMTTSPFHRLPDPFYAHYAHEVVVQDKNSSSHRSL
jgi:hypothetical protein